MLFAAASLSAIIPIFVFVGIVVAIWAVLSVISDRNSRLQARVDRYSRNPSLSDRDDSQVTKKNERFQGIADMAKAMADPMMPKTDLEQSNLRTKLATATVIKTGATQGARWCLTEKDS